MPKDCIDSHPSRFFFKIQLGRVVAAHEVIRIEGAAWNDLAKLEETRLQKLDFELKTLVERLLEAGSIKGEGSDANGQEMSTEASSRMRRSLDSSGPNYGPGTVAHYSINTATEHSE